MKFRDKSNWKECAEKNCEHYIIGGFSPAFKFCGWYSSPDNPNRSRNAKLRPCHLVGKCPIEKGGVKE